MHYMAETPAFSLFPLSPALFLLFLLGYPAGALRGGERTRYESDLNWRVHSNPLFTCLCLLNFPISSFRFKVDKQSPAEAGLWAKACVCHNCGEYVFLKVNLIIMLPRLRKNYLSHWKFSSSPNNKLAFFLYTCKLYYARTLPHSKPEKNELLTCSISCVFGFYKTKQKHCESSWLKPKSIKRLERN